jgi:hypothetical protein
MTAMTARSDNLPVSGLEALLARIGEKESGGEEENRP